MASAAAPAAVPAATAPKSVVAGAMLDVGDITALGRGVGVDVGRRATAEVPPDAVLAVAAGVGVGDVVVPVVAAAAWPCDADIAPCAESLGVGLTVVAAGEADGVAAAVAAGGAAVAAAAAGW
jgi:hypothetical protein